MDEKSMLRTNYLFEDSVCTEFYNSADCNAGIMSIPYLIKINQAICDLLKAFKIIIFFTCPKDIFLLEYHYQIFQFVYFPFHMNLNLQSRNHN
jgi:hypothetical protein